MVGTGPFKFKEWVVGDHVTIVKNPDYWNTDGMAHLDEVDLQAGRRGGAALNGLQTGEHRPRPDDRARSTSPTIQGNPNLQVIDRGESCNTVPDLDEPQRTSRSTTRRSARRSPTRSTGRRSIDAFYAGQAVAGRQLDAARHPVRQAARACRPTTSRRPRPLIAESGETDLTIDFYYPSDVTRPYMPDPKGIFEAITARPRGRRLHDRARTPRPGGPTTSTTSTPASRDVAHRLDLRLGRPGQLPQHRVLRLRRRRAVDRVRLQERRARARP